MALVKCPNCEKEISDKAMQCPNCQTVLAKENVDETKCLECGNVIDIGDEKCSNCGCPISSEETQPQKVEVTSVNIKSFPKKKVVTIGIIALVLVVAIFLVSVLVQNAKQKKYQESLDAYQESLEYVVGTMYEGAVDAEEATDLIKAVWRNTIYEESDEETDKFTKSENGWLFNDDFNDSLKALFSDGEFMASLIVLRANRTNVEESMKSLKDVPQEYENVYPELVACYNAYIEYTEMALNPSGSLQTYSSNVNDSATEFIKCYKSIQLYVE